jgi:hypothetical protein
MARQALQAHVLFVILLIYLSISKFVNHSTYQSTLPQTPFSFIRPRINAMLCVCLDSEYLP